MTPSPSGIGEALALCPGDVDRLGGAIRVRGRSDRRRTVRVDPTAVSLMDRWMAARSELGAGELDPLFCTLAGDSLHAAYVRELLPRLAAKAGVTQRVHSEALRQTHALDPTASWPTDREERTIGRLEVDEAVRPEGAGLVFDPTRVTDGIECADDPVLHARAGAYRLSAERRPCGTAAAAGHGCDPVPVAGQDVSQQSTTSP